MAKLTEIINNEEMTATDKVQAISAIVKKARAKYGNEEVEISIPEIPTENGIVDLTLLSDEDKVALASRYIKQIIIMATEESKAVEGVMLDKEIEKLLATSQLLVNISESVDSEYI